VLACVLSDAPLKLTVALLSLLAKKQNLFVKLGQIGDVSQSELVARLSKLQVMVHVRKSQLEHPKNQLVPLLDETLLLLLEGAKSGGIHLGKCIDVVGASELSVNLHNELSLAVQFLSVEEFLVFELAAGFVGLLRLGDLIHASLNDLVLQQDALLQLLRCLGQPLFSRSVVPFVVSTLLVKFKFERSGDVSFECQDIEIGVALHKIRQAHQPFLDIHVDAQVLGHMSGHQVADFRGLLLAGLGSGARVGLACLIVATGDIFIQVGVIIGGSGASR